MDASIEPKDTNTVAASRDRSDVDPSEEPSARSPADTEAQDRSPDIDAAVAHAEDRWRRTAADLDNLRKRYARDVDRERATERAKVTAAWLPVLDNLELALTHAGSDPGSIIQGVQAIRDQAVQLLEGSVTRATATPACRSRPPSTRWWVWSTHRMCRRARWWRWYAPAMARKAANCGLRQWL